MALNKILVTGASGEIGRKTILHLIKRVPKSQVVGLVRDPAKAKDLADLGIELRKGDYMEPATLAEAFKGIEKVMLTSAHAFTDRKTSQGNVIDEAANAGVKHLVMMSIARKQNSKLVMKEITEEDIFTEQKLRDSGMDYTFVYHPPFLDVLAFYIGPKAQETGIHVPAGDGKFTAATRNDLAEAHAAILSGKDHESKTYTLTGHPPISFADIAVILTKLTGKKVPFERISEKQYIEIVNGAGFPEHLAPFVYGWINNMGNGEWALETKDLETLIGHKPETPTEYFRDHYLPKKEAA